MNCPKCNDENVYQDRDMNVCPMCGHEWSGKETQEPSAPQGKVYKDANGNVLQDGDNVTIIKDLKVKGAPKSVKVGTKVKGIRLVESNDGHDIDCTIKGFGAMKLKSEFVKKSND